MPTGYTSIIDENEDVTFKQFASKCAYAFGALVDYRESRHRDELPKSARLFKSTYHTDALKRAKEDLLKYKEMSLKAAERLSSEEFDMRHAEWERTKRETDLIIARYERMKSVVSTWVPPSKEHTRFKEFMLEQLDIGKPHDSSGWEPKKVPAKVWLKNNIQNAMKDVQYHTAAIEKEEKGAKEANKWVRLLREAL